MITVIACSMCRMLVLLECGCGNLQAEKYSAAIAIVGGRQTYLQHKQIHEPNSGYYVGHSYSYIVSNVTVNYSSIGY